MGKTFSTGLLTDGIAQDSSNNIGIGGAANASYKLAVTGASLFSSSITANGGNIVINADANYSGYSAIGFNGNVSNGSAKIFTANNGSDAIYYAASTGQGHTFRVNGGTSTESVKFFSNGNVGLGLTGGNVGIGTSSPGGLLSLSSSNSKQLTISSSEAWTSGSIAEMIAHHAIGISQFRSSVTNGMYFGIVSGNTPAIQTADQSNNAISLSINPYGGSVLINTTTAVGSPFQVQGNTWLENASAVPQYLNRTGNDGGLVVFLKAGVQVGVIATNTYTLPSDINFKKNISTLDLGLNLVSKLKPVSYNHKIDDDDAALSTGFIAQELEQSLTELGVEKNKYYLLQHIPNEKEGESQYWVDYQKMIPVLVNAIQELSSKVTALENK